MLSLLARQFRQILSSSFVALAHNGRRSEDILWNIILKTSHSECSSNTSSVCVTSVARLTGFSSRISKKSAPGGCAKQPSSGLLGLGDQRRYGIARKAMVSQTGIHNRFVHGMDRLVCAITDDGALVGRLKEAQISRYTGLVGLLKYSP